MSGTIKNNRRSKSGLLTGLMIVSTGLIAGFQGFELAMTDQDGPQYNLPTTNQSAARQHREAVARRVSALDELINSSLKKHSENKNSVKQGNDRQRLADLINSTQVSSPRLVVHPVVARTSGPVVNRALKRNRGQAPDRSYRDALESIKRAAKPAVKPAPVKPTIIHKPAKIIVAKAIPTKAMPKTEVPIADSADIALFAADMPLPAKLVFSGVRKGRVPSLSKRYAGGYNGSPLVPRKFRSGKAFGGLGERAFQKRERRCMTTALYFEARSEPESGQVAVGQVVMNRVRSPDYPDTICGVVYQGSNRRTGCQFSFTCDGKADKPNSPKHWKRSKRLANSVLEGRAWLKSIGNATHYHADYVKPRWRRKMARLKKIGRHIFYKAPKVSVTETYQRYISGKRS